MKIKYVHRKRAKGNTYWYFDTGAKKPSGERILTPLPDPSHPTFGRKLADCRRARTMREKPPAQLMTISRLADLYEKSEKFRKLAEGTKRIYRTYLDVIRDQIGPAVADELTRKHARLLMDSMADRPGAANMTIRTLGALYSWGREHDHVKARPTEGMEMLEVGEHDPWPEWLLLEALEADDALVRNAVALLYYTAQRIGDVSAMRWTDVAGGRVRVRQEKTGTDLDFAQHEELSAMLAAMPKLGMTILAKPDGLPYAASTLRRTIQAWAAKRRQEVVPHGLRKNAVNALIQAGCSTWEIQAISGQSPAMIEHYAKRRNRSKLGDAAVLKWGRKS